MKVLYVFFFISLSSENAMLDMIMPFIAVQTSQNFVPQYVNPSIKLDLGQNPWDYKREKTIPQTKYKMSDIFQVYSPRISDAALDMSFDTGGSGGAGGLGGLRALKKTKQDKQNTKLNI